MSELAKPALTLADAKAAFDRGDFDQAKRLAMSLAGAGGSGPGAVQAYHFAGIIEIERRNAELARDLLRKAALLAPGRASALANLAQMNGGDVTAEQRLKSALRAAIAQPASPLCIAVLASCYADCAQIFRRQSAFGSAFKASKRALILRPDLPEALRGAVIERRWLGILQDIAGVLDRAAGVLERVKQVYPASISLLAGYATAEDQLRAAEAAFARMPIAGTARPRIASVPGRKLHIGYVGSYLGGHALATALPEIFRHHDRNSVQLSVYATPKPDGVAAWNRNIEMNADRVVDLSGLEPSKQAEAIRRDQVDIAIDLDGYLGEPLNLFCHAPAPVQVNYFGYPGTCGRLHDYIIGDPVLMPSWASRYYGEKIVRLPHSYIPFDRDQSATGTPGRAEYGLPDEAFVFAAQHSQNKISADSFDSWMDCLRQVPESLLWLLEHSPEHRENLTAAAKRHGIEPQRLLFAPKVPRPRHLARLPLADLYLDNCWYNAHTTAVDALWMGLPFVSFFGTAFASRVGASVLHAAGLPDLVGRDRHEMAEIAVGLARTPERLAAIRKQLFGNGRSAPLFDMKLYTRGLEKAFHAIAERARAGLSPDDITIRP